MEMHQIRYFLAVAEERHISRAAERCNVSQPSLSRAIKKLEEELGGALFERKPGRVDLTEFGRRIEPHLRHCIDNAATAKDTAMAFLNGRDKQIRLGIMSGVFHKNLLTLIKRLESKFNDVEINLRQGANSNLMPELQNDKIDIVITTKPHDGWSSRMHSEPLYDENFVVVFPPGHRFETLSSVPLQDVLAEKLLSGPTNGQNLLNGSEHDISLNVSVKPFLRIESQCVLQAMIASGAGCAIIPEFVPRQPGLVCRPLSGSGYSRKVYWVSMRGRPHSAVISHFVRMIRSIDWLGQRMELTSDQSAK